MQFMPRPVRGSVACRSPPQCHCDSRRTAIARSVGHSANGTASTTVSGIRARIRASPDAGCVTRISTRPWPNQVAADAAGNMASAKSSAKSGDTGGLEIPNRQQVIDPASGAWLATCSVVTAQVTARERIPLPSSLIERSPLNLQGTARPARATSLAPRPVCTQRGNGTALGPIVVCVLPYRPCRRSMRASQIDRH
jgi:hypothetical protein